MLLILVYHMEHDFTKVCARDEGYGTQESESIILILSDLYTSRNMGCVDPHKHV